MAESSPDGKGGLHQLARGHNSLLSDSTLRAIRGGEDLAWATLHEHLALRLQKLAVKKVDSELRIRTSPSDLVQETFLLAHRSASGFRGKSLAEVFAWITCILTNRIRKAYRDEKNTRRRSLHREVSWYERRRASILEETGVTPSKVVLENEERELIDRAFRVLSQEDQSLISDHFIKGLSLSDIAKRTGKSDVAIRKHWSRALSRWRRQTQILSGDSELRSS